MLRERHGKHVLAGEVVFYHGGSFLTFAAGQPFIVRGTARGWTIAP
jgi:hypothetical protein